MQQEEHCASARIVQCSAAAANSSGGGSSQDSVPCSVHQVESLSSCEAARPGIRADSSNVHPSPEYCTVPYFGLTPGDEQCCKAVMVVPGRGGLHSDVYMGTDTGRGAYVIGLGPAWPTEVRMGIDTCIMSMASSQARVSETVCWDPGLWGWSIDLYSM